MDGDKPHIDAINEEEARRIARLITCFIQGTLSEKEWDDLDDWIAASDKNMQLFEQLTDENHLTESVEWLRQVGNRAAMQKAGGRNRARAPLQRSIRKIWIYGAAAIILVVSGTAYYKYAFSPVEKNIPILEWPVSGYTEAGDKNPMLILGDGKRISLSPQADSSVMVSPHVYAHIAGKVLSYVKGVDDLAESDWNILQTPAGNDYEAILSDGTKVRLNAASALRYPASFNKDERVVELRGEAYFEAQEDKTRPFLVKCGNATVKVTGTRFNIDAYPEEDRHSITLLEGSVEIRRLDQLIKLLPYQQAILFPGEEMVVRDDTKAAEHIAWTRGVFSFRKASIEEVMKQVAKWYGITVLYNAQIDQEFSGNIPRSSTVEEVLQMLTLSGGIRFAIHGKQVIVQP